MPKKTNWLLNCSSVLCFVVYIDISLFKNLGRMLFSYLLCLYFFHVPGFVHLIFLLMFFFLYYMYMYIVWLFRSCSQLCSRNENVQNYLQFFCKSNNFSNPSFYYYLFSVISGQCIFKCILLLCATSIRKIANILGRYFFFGFFTIFFPYKNYVYLVHTKQLNKIAKIF